MNNNYADVENRVLKIYKDYISSDEIKENLNSNSVLNDIGINSIDFIKIIVALETEFDFEFDDDDLQPEKYVIVKDIVDYIIEKTDV